MYMGIGSKAFRGPEVRSQPGKERGIHIEKALDRARGAKDPGEESTGVILVARRRQPALEKPAGDFPEQRMLGGNACFREEGDRIEGAQHRLPSLLKAGAQVVVSLQHAYPADQAGLVGALRALLPDAGKKLEEGGG